MNLFGIPLFISFSYFRAFISENLPMLQLSDDILFISWLLTNYMYIICIVLFICLACKIIIYFKNRLC